MNLGPDLQNFPIIKFPYFLIGKRYLISTITFDYLTRIAFGAKFL